MKDLYLLVKGWIAQNVIGLLVAAGAAIVVVYQRITLQRLESKLTASYEAGQREKARADLEREKAIMATQAETAQREALDKVRQRLREEYDHAEFESKKDVDSLRGPELLAELRKTIRANRNSGVTPAPVQPAKGTGTARKP